MGRAHPAAQGRGFRRTAKRQRQSSPVCPPQDPASDHGIGAHEEGSRHGTRGANPERGGTMTQHYSVVVERESNGTFSAWVAGLPGVYAAADTAGAAKRGIRAALTAHIDALARLGRTAKPQADVVVLRHDIACAGRAHATDVRGAGCASRPAHEPGKDRSRAPERPQGWAATQGGDGVRATRRVRSCEAKPRWRRRLVARPDEDARPLLRLRRRGGQTGGRGDPTPACGGLKACGFRHLVRPDRFAMGSAVLVDRCPRCGASRRTRSRLGGRASAMHTLVETARGATRARYNGSAWIWL